MNHPFSENLRPTPRRSRRSGFTLIECLGAFAVLSGALVVLLLSFGMLRQSERQFNQQQLALETAANLLAKAAAVPYGELTAERAHALASESSWTDQLPGGKSELLLRDEPAATPPLKHLRARIQWNSPGGQPAEVSLERVRFATIQEAKP